MANWFGPEFAKVSLTKESGDDAYIAQGRKVAADFHFWRKARGGKLVHNYEDDFTAFSLEFLPQFDDDLEIAGATKRQMQAFNNAASIELAKLQQSGSSMTALLGSTGIRLL